MQKINRQLWKQFLEIAQPYFYPLEPQRSTSIFLGLLVLLIMFLFAAMFTLVSVFTLGLQALLPKTFDTVAENLVKAVTGIIHSPLIVMVAAMLIIPSTALFIFRRALLPRWKPWVLLSLLLMLSLSVSGLNVIISFVGRFFQNALVAKNQPEYWRFLFVYAGVFVVGTPTVVIYRFVRSKLGIYWREWLTYHYLDRYFRNRSYYDINASKTIDNPDQRISEDIRSFTANTLGYLLLILGEAIDLIAFTGVLLSISGSLTVALIVYAFFGTTLTILIGRPLIRLNFNQLRWEADFRYGLVHVRDNAESISFYQGEAQESQQVRSRFVEVFRNFNLLIGWQRNLEFFTTGYNYFVIVLPAIVVAPMYFAGKIDFGAISQASFAFGQVLAAFSLIVNQFETLSGFIAGVNRLSSLADALQPTKRLKEGQTVIDTVEGSRLALEHITLQTPNYERILVQDLSVALQPGQGLVIIGPSGVGKSSILRAIAGLWNAGIGKIIRPKAEEMLFLPQRPYMILGTLRAQLLYPQTPSDTPETALQKALELVNLADLPERLGGFDIDLDWGDVLSLGEQQRLAIARLILTRPPFAILDEATSALDLRNEQQIYERIKATSATFVSVGHRPSLLQYHQHVLELTGDTTWRLMPTEDYMLTAENFT